MKSEHASPNLFSSSGGAGASLMNTLGGNVGGWFSGEERSNGLLANGETSGSTSSWWFIFSSTSDVIYPNVFSPEMYNLFIMMIYVFLIYWFYRLVKTTLSNSYLFYVIRSGAFNVVNVCMIV